MILSRKLICKEVIITPKAINIIIDDIKNLDYLDYLEYSSKQRIHLSREM